MLDIIVFAEAEADARMARDLGDRVMRERGPEWLGDALSSVREWRGLESDQTFVKWADLKHHLKSQGIPRYIGHSKSGAKGSDYAMAYKALLLVHQLAQNKPVVIMLRDHDNATDGRAGLRQAGEEPKFKGLCVIVGIANRAREAWVLNGYCPDSPGERRCLDQLQANLAFDPVTNAHRLRATNTGEQRSAKRVLAALTAEDHQRQAQCWIDTPLDLLFERGEKTGLRGFLLALEKNLLPAATHQSS